jgi:hypothetical protein
MARTPPRPGRKTPRPHSFLGCLRLFLTPQAFKEARRGAGSYQATRWRLHPLLCVLLLMTWCAGQSLEERFETARTFSVASYRRRRHPGKTPQGFAQALARRRAAAIVRSRLASLFAERLQVDGFVPIGCDGTRLNGPRTPELEQRLRANPRPFDVPSVFVWALVHLPTGLLWSWRLGGPRASEHDHLARLVATWPRGALLVADAGYLGFALLRGLLAARQSFLIRLKSNVPLYTPQRGVLSRPREGRAYYWPKKAPKQGLPPVLVRLIRLRGQPLTGQGKKVAVWLMTDVLEEERLPRATAGKFYRWRWRNEGFFRTYKGTLGKVKLLGRTVQQVHREAEGSLLAVQLLLAHQALARPAAGRGGAVPQARHAVRVIRSELQEVAGSYLQGRPRRPYLERLGEARVDRRRQRHNQVRRRWPTRVNHKPPKPPKLQRLGEDLKAVLETTLRTE